MIYLQVGARYINGEESNNVKNVVDEEINKHLQVKLQI